MIGLRFRLRPVREITPWGGERAELHWFALTEGWYWIEAGGHELLRYSPSTLRGWTDEQGGGGQSVPYVDYYAARLWQDVLAMVSVLTEPVPADLVEFVAGELPHWPSRQVTPQAEATGPPRGVHLDLGRLRREHRDRAI